MQRSRQSNAVSRASAATSTRWPLRGVTLATVRSRAGPALRDASRGAAGFAVPGGTTAIRAAATP